MDENELKRLIYNRIWIFQNNISENRTDSIKIGDNGGRFAIIMRSDGTISFPTKVEFVPSDYIKWKLNVLTENIEIMTYDGKVTHQLSIPSPSEDNQELLVMYEGENAGFFNHSNFDQKLVSSGVIGGTNIIFIPKDNSANLNELFEREMSIHRSNKLGKNIEYLNEVFDYLIEHHKVEKVALLFEKLDEQVNFDKVDNTTDILYKISNGIIARRSIMIEFLSTLITEFNYQKLNKKKIILKNLRVKY